MSSPGASDLDALIAEATVDAHDEGEQAMGFHAVIEDELAVPFETTVLGVEVTVERVELTGDDRLVAICRRDGIRQPIALADLPLPAPLPVGAEWIGAYRHWLG